MAQKRASGSEAAPSVGRAAERERRGRAVVGKVASIVHSDYSALPWEVRGITEFLPLV